MTPCLTNCLLSKVVAHSHELKHQPDHTEDTELNEWFDTQEAFITHGDEFNYDGPLSWSNA